MTDRPLTIDIRHLLLLKANELFLVTREDGVIAPDIAGFGLFYRDTRYLAHYALRLNDTDPLLLTSSDRQGVAAQMVLTNRDFPAADGRTIDTHSLAIDREFLLLEDGVPAFVDRLTLCNFSARRVSLALSLVFGAAFEDLFVLRGTPPAPGGRLHAPEWDGATLRFCYEGADGLRRSLHIGFSLPVLLVPRRSNHAAAHLELLLDPQQRQELMVTFRPDERPIAEMQPEAQAGFGGAAVLARAKGKAMKRLHAGFARVETPSDALEEALSTALTDLALLAMRRGERRFTAAGIPWFVGLFGRDSLLPTIQCLAFNPDLGAQTARALADWQGSKRESDTREEPGKILHELRVGELANLHKVPQVPSYVSVDATLLFLIVIARHVAWSGSLDLFQTLRPNIDRALAWLERKAAENAFGYVAYAGLAEGGQPVNQSWRDSGTGVLRGDGTYPVPPLALVEVQGYAFEARKRIAAILRRLGEEARAAQLDADADRLRACFLKDFWMEEEGCYCLALEASGAQVASVTSNAAQVLWTGIATEEHAHRIAQRMMQDDMFSGWGIRTLSADHPRFDPLAYQQGSIWPFDNALIVSGFRRYGEDEAALRVAMAMLDAARCFRSGRLPEFFAGIARSPGGAPAHAPRADPLQAWSAAALPFMLSELLGIESDGFAKVVRVRRPLLPDRVDRVMLHDLRPADGRVSLRFTRAGGGVRAEFVGEGGGLDLRIE